MDNRLTLQGWAVLLLLAAASSGEGARLQVGGDRASGDLIYGKAM